MRMSSISQPAVRLNPRSTLSKRNRSRMLWPAYGSMLTVSSCQGELALAPSYSTAQLAPLSVEISTTHWS